MAESNWTATKARQTFIDFFVKQHGHTFVPSSSVVPHNDPTLLFTNSGMVQFKDKFLNQVPASSPLAGLKRAANSQKCIRAGGKHNDLDDVGKDSYHHCMFEMLGNWSFGDYFQEEAIKWAWELLTDVYGLDKDRLYVTYFEGDKNENLEPDLKAKEIWKRYVAEDHILPGNKKDNFWEMGATGPCGPCSEIHYDRIGGRNAADRVNKNDPMVIEIWNNVFMAYNREPNGKLKPLPVKHVDTGMGFERLLSILQGKLSNYDTDLFTPIFEEIQKVTKAQPYTGKYGSEDEGRKDMAYRVIADHIRTLTFAVADGARPGPVGRGFVLRRVLRRAVRFGRECLKAEFGFFHKLVNVVVLHFGEIFPECAPNPFWIKKEQDTVIQVLRLEEKAFSEAVDNGIKNFNALTKNLKPGDKIPDDDVFVLHRSYGFPVDLTKLMAEEKGLSVDEKAFQERLEKQREESRAADWAKQQKSKLELSQTDIHDLKTRVHAMPTDERPKYGVEDVDATVIAIWHFHDTTPFSLGIILDRSNFYAESGGQAWDKGELIDAEDPSLTAFVVEEVQSCGGYVIHLGRLGSGVYVGHKVICRIDRHRRRLTMANHTATHMVNFAMREVFGDGVDQKGSLVNAEQLRFDYSLNRQPTKLEFQRIETIVSDMIYAQLPVYSKELPLELARRISGVRAVFGEKYPNPVRVVSIGADLDEVEKAPMDDKWRKYAIEFCGGTHLRNVREADQFCVVSDASIQAGVRRIHALTGDAAVAALQLAGKLEAELEDIQKVADGVAKGKRLAEFSDIVTHAQIPHWRRVTLKEKLEPLLEERSVASKQTVKAQSKSSEEYARDVAQKLRTGSDHSWVDTVELGGNQEQVHKTAKAIAEMAGKPVAVLLVSADRTPNKEKVVLVANVHRDLSSKLSASEWVKHAIATVGGKGGGKAEVAQGQADGKQDTTSVVSAAKSYAQSKGL